MMVGWCSGGENTAARSRAREPRKKRLGKARRGWTRLGVEGGLPVWSWRRKHKAKDHLDRTLLKWSDDDQFRLRDLLNGGVLFLGRAGSGKTSASGRTLMQAVVAHPRSAGLVGAAKPEDVYDVRDVFRRAGRLDDLIVFDESGPWRCNHVGEASRGQPRNAVQFVTAMSEVLKRGEGQGGDGKNSRFYEKQEGRLLENTVIALQAAGEPISSDGMHAFLMTAANAPAEMQTEAWQGKYHSNVLERGHYAPKSPMQAHDHRLAFAYFTQEWPNMDKEVRANILAGVMGTLHTFATGLVREMVGGQTNCSPADVLGGKWLLCNFPPCVYGDVGLLITAGWKHLVEQAVLQRRFDGSMPFVTIWLDEYSQCCDRWDAHYICQARSHGGALVALLAVGGVHLCRDARRGGAAFRRRPAGQLLPRHRSCQRPCNGEMGVIQARASQGNPLQRQLLAAVRTTTVWDMMYGQQHVSSLVQRSTTSSVLQDQEFMVGRTGGPDNGYLADAIVIKSGEPFADGKSYKRVTFSQR